MYALGNIWEEKNHLYAAVVTVSIFGFPWKQTQRLKGINLEQIQYSLLDDINQAFLLIIQAVVYYKWSSNGHRVVNTQQNVIGIFWHINFFENPLCSYVLPVLS